MKELILYLAISGVAPAATFLIFWSGRRRQEPSSNENYPVGPAKIGLGLALLSAVYAFFITLGLSQLARASNHTSITAQSHLSEIFPLWAVIAAQLLSVVLAMLPYITAWLLTPGAAKRLWQQLVKKVHNQAPVGMVA